MSKSRQSQLLNLTPEEEEALKQWALPDMPVKSKKREGWTNVVGKPNNWRYEPPEPEPEPPKPPTLEEIEAIRQQAYEEGFAEGKAEGQEKGHAEGVAQGFKEGHEQGLAQGKEEGYAEGQARGDELAAQWQALADATLAPMNALDEAVEKQLVLVAAKLAEAVIGVECQTNPQVLLNALKTGVDVLPLSQGEVEILLHPEDLELVKSHYGEEQLKERRWRLLAEPTMERGGCQLQNASSTVDLTIKQKLKETLELFLQESGIAS